MLSEISTVALGQKVAAPLAGLGDRPFSSDSVKKNRCFRAIAAYSKDRPFETAKDLRSYLG